MAANITLLGPSDVVEMTTIINRRQTGRKALTRILFREESAVPLEESWVNADVLTGQIGMAPYVLKNGKAVAITRLNGTTQQISTPFINQKAPLTCNEDLMKRRPGELPVVGMGASRSSATQRLNTQILEDLETMDETVKNRREWWIAHLLRGSVTYDVENHASYYITTGRPDDNEFVVDVLWSESDAMPLSDIATARGVVLPYNAPTFQVGLCAPNVATQIREMLQNETIKSIKTDSGVTAGHGDLTQGYTTEGMMYLATLGGIPIYEYAGSYTDDDTGDTENFIRDGYIEFLAPYNSRDNKTYYGLIPDAKAVAMGLAVGKSYSTYKYDEDGGAYIAYHKTRPMDWFRHPEYNVSMQVL